MNTTSEQRATIPNETLAAIEEAGKRATKRPWHWATSNSMRRLSTERRDGEVAFGQIHPHDKTADIAIDDRDMRYSELAANHADTIAAELRELREKMERVRAILGNPDSWDERDLTTRIIVHNTEARELAELIGGNPH